jgi:hypothetical protein
LRREIDDPGFDGDISVQLTTEVEGVAGWGGTCGVSGELGRGTSTGRSRGRALGGLRGSVVVRSLICYSCYCPTVEGCTVGYTDVYSRLCGDCMGIACSCKGWGAVECRCNKK